MIGSTTSRPPDHLSTPFGSCHTVGSCIWQGRWSRQRPASWPWPGVTRCALVVLKRPEPLPWLYPAGLLVESYLQVQIYGNFPTSNNAENILCDVTSQMRYDRASFTPKVIIEANFLQQNVSYIFLPF